MGLEIFLTSGVGYETSVVFSANITHNMSEMAKSLGIYECLWQHRTMDIVQAEQLIAPLEKALDTIQGDRARYQAFAPSNGWGDCDIFASFISLCLNACREFPDTNVIISR